MIYTSRNSLDDTLQPEQIAEYYPLPVRTPKIERLNSLRDPGSKRLPKGLGPTPVNGDLLLALVKGRNNDGCDPVSTAYPLLDAGHTPFPDTRVTRR